MKKILFLCTGNYYRSRFAEHLFNWLAIKHGLDWQADSRGLALERGVNNVGPISRYVLEALAVRLVNVTNDEQFPQPASEQDFQELEEMPQLYEQVKKSVGKHPNHCQSMMLSRFESSLRVTFRCSSTHLAESLKPYIFR